MNHSFEYIDIILLVMIAGFIFLRLRGILGKRTGHEKNLDAKELNENQSIFFNKLCNFFLYKDLTDYTSGFICIKKNIFNSYLFTNLYI